MINRLLIRIKVLQVLYAYYLRSDMNEESALDLLEEQLEASYKLYLNLCGLPIELVRIADFRKANEIEKFKKNDSIVDSLNGLITNPLFQSYSSQSSEFVKQYDDNRWSSQDIVDYHNSVLDNMINDSSTSELDWSNGNVVKVWWRELYGKHYLQSSQFEEYLQELSPFLNDDIRVVFTFVTKAVNSMDANRSIDEVIKPKYADGQVKAFGHQLLIQAIDKGTEFREIISSYLRNWDKGRVSKMDFLIMQLAVAEATKFPLTPTNVIINEYLNLAHYYSAPNSHVYINGILHELFTEINNPK